KSRSAVRNANAAVHSAPLERPELYLYPGNVLWTLVFGWWMALLMFVISIVLLLTPNKGPSYARVMRGLAGYLFWPFGRYVERREASDSEIGEETLLNGGTQNGITETSPLLARPGYNLSSRRSYYGDDADTIEWVPKRKKGWWGSLRELGLGGIVFYIF